MTANRLDISNMRTLMMVLVVALGCHRSTPPSATSGGNQSSSEEDHDPFSNSPADESTKTSEANFDGRVRHIENTISETERLASTPFDPTLTVGDINHVLQQCVEHLLADEELQKTREFYGTPASTEVVLVTESSDGLKWPASFKPDVEGWTIRFDKPDSDHLNKDRVLGIRLRKLDLNAPSSGFMNGNITLMVTNVGGTRNGAVIGGCLAYFTIDRAGKGYAATFAGSLDP